MKRFFNRSYREARKAEARGEYREAAEHYAVADAPDEAANALLFLAAKSTDLGIRISAYQDALRWIDENDLRYVTVQTALGDSVIERAQQDGVHEEHQRRALREAAKRLEEISEPGKAATAYELLGDTESLSRCLQEAGEVDRLEALLNATTEQAREDQEFERLAREYRMSMKVGARIEAKRAIQKALTIKDDPGLRNQLRILDEGLQRGRARLSLARRELVVLWRPKVILGRDGDLRVRGVSVSRQHTEVRKSESGLEVQDLESRNGTLIAGVPISGTLEVKGEAVVGLGADASVRVSKSNATIRFEVLSGLDRGLEAYAADSPFDVEELGGRIISLEGCLSLRPASKVRLNGEPTTAPIVLVQGDVIETASERIEVQ